MPESRPPLPPFDEESARRKVLGAEAAWNSRDPSKVAGAYSIDSEWRNRDLFLNGRDEIREFLAQKWARERDYSINDVAIDESEKRLFGPRDQGDFSGIPLR